MNNPSTHISIILLAAGASTRMGQSKQLLTIRGESLLTHSIKVALSSPAQHVIVVLGANENEHYEIIRDFPVTIIANHDWHNGMGGSLKKGIIHLKEVDPDCDAAIIMVCDQPLISPEHIKKLIQVYRSSGSFIIASFYKNMPGVPALFSKKYFDELLQLDDSEGAKRIILQNKSKTKLVDFPEGAADLDTPDDYRKFMEDKDERH